MTGPVGGSGIPAEAPGVVPDETPRITDDELAVMELALEDLRGMCSPEGERDAIDEVLDHAGAAAAEIRRLRREVAALTAQRDAAQALAQNLAAISSALTASYPPGMDPELVMRRRVGKIHVEAGELGDAVEGYTAENPRKGQYATADDVVKELLDCASASLCAVEHMTGDKGDSLGMLAAQVAGNRVRLDAALAGASPVAADPAPIHSKDVKPGETFVYGDGVVALPLEDRPADPPTEEQR